MTDVIATIRSSSSRAGSNKESRMSSVINWFDIPAVAARAPLH